MAARHALLAAGLAWMATGVACVDLFHSTDFETLCSGSAADGGCTAADGGAAGPEGAVSAPPGTDRPHPDFCAWDARRARAEAERACAWLGACEGPLEESAFGRCVIHAQLAFDCAANPARRPAGATDRFWGCLATASTCAEIDGCVFPGGVQGCSPLASGSFNQCASLQANAATRVECVAGVGQQRAAGVEPCVMLGQTCANENGGVARCGGALGYDGGCSGSVCQGTSVVDCDVGPVVPFDRGMDCALHGGSCTLDGAGVPVCQPGLASPACLEDALPACSGDVVTACAGGKEIRVDCRGLGLPCEVDGATRPHEPASACGRRSGPDVCSERADERCVSANVLESCGRGVLHRLDCASVGLGECKVTNGRAACTPPAP